MNRRHLTVLTLMVGVALPSLGQSFNLGSAKQFTTAAKSAEFDRIFAELIADEVKERTAFGEQVEQAIENVPEIARVAAKINEAAKTPRKNARRIDNLRQEVGKKA